MQRVVLEFRTPQHPSLGTNNWGGASPLLARNIPKESLEHKYAKLNSLPLRTHDHIFPADYDDDDGAFKKGGRGILMKLLFFRKEKAVTVSVTTKTATLGSSLKRRWLLPRLDPQNRWPQGWC